MDIWLAFAEWVYDMQIDSRWSDGPLFAQAN